MYSPSTRLLTVLEILQARSQVTGPELARSLEVEVRSVRRYITMLQDMGVPVEAERGRYGAYRLRPGFKLPPLMFNDEEALAVMLGLLTVRRLGLAVAAPATEGAIAKIERVLPQAVRGRVGAVQETLVLDMRSWDAPPVGEALLMLASAAYQRQRVQLRYCNFAGVQSERAFDPYGLVYQAGLWYAAGFCHLRRDLRVFRCDRVLGVAPGEEAFERPSDFDALAVVRAAIAAMPGTWQVEVVLELDPDEARRRAPSAFVRIEETAGETVLYCFSDDLDRTAHMIAGLRCPVRVRQPTELRAAFQRLAEHTASLGA